MGIFSTVKKFTKEIKESFSSSKSEDLLAILSKENISEKERDSILKKIQSGSLLNEKILDSDYREKLIKLLKFAPSISEEEKEAYSHNFFSEKLYVLLFDGNNFPEIKEINTKYSKCDFKTYEFKSSVLEHGHLFLPLLNNNKFQAIEVFLKEITHLEFNSLDRRLRTTLLTYLDYPALNREWKESVFRLMPKEIGAILFYNLSEIEKLEVETKAGVVHNNYLEVEQNITLTLKDEVKIKKFKQLKSKLSHEENFDTNSLSDGFISRNERIGRKELSFSESYKLNTTLYKNEYGYYHTLIKNKKIKSNIYVNIYRFLNFIKKAFIFAIVLLLLMYLYEEFFIKRGTNPIELIKSIDYVTLKNDALKYLNIVVEYIRELFGRIIPR